MLLRKLRKSCIKVMTWNIYFGADLSPLIGTTPEQIPEVMSEVFDQVQQTDFFSRAKSIAIQIYKTRPDLIGLHEVALWTVQSMQANSAINFLRILLWDLKKLGLEYNVIAVNKNFRDQLPSSTGEVIGLLDRDVILAKSDTRMKFTHIQERNFSINLVVPIGGQPFTVLRGWSSVDVSIDKEMFRLVNTHLEGDSTEVRLAQANELLKNACATNLPLILMGDFNTDADGNDNPTYELFIDSGFIDAWNIVGKCSGFTAFQARDLLNAISTLSERIDFIFIRNDFKVLNIATVGNLQKDRTSIGLWPSDHAGIIATLK
ncbi:endonuclease/exonuclease/phosphatase family protein [Vallitalea okinawensis]|uniref:endonuclease/exonuclease/phosphatase family protein n=1 Tax=Vallitalea okinawensis TaxID=2078660 RepID=UPI001A9A32D4|nr:endonuclease/exonuclease/phosphatase family protein [Vallitalea okinawensis]